MGRAAGPGHNRGGSFELGSKAPGDTREMKEGQ